MIPLDAVSVNGSAALQPKGRAAIDTGTSLIATPHADAAAIYAAIPGAALDAARSDDNLHVYSVPCDTTSVVSLTFNGVSYPIPLENFILPKDITNDPDRCTGAIQGNAKVG